MLTVVQGHPQMAIWAGIFTEAPKLNTCACTARQNVMQASIQQAKAEVHGVHKFWLISYLSNPVRPPQVCFQLSSYSEDFILKMDVYNFF